MADNAVKEFIKIYSKEALKNTERFLNTIDDLMPQEGVEKNTIRAAAKNGVYIRLAEADSADDEAKELVIKEIITSLTEEHGLADKWAVYAVQCYVEAAGWKVRPGLPEDKPSKPAPKKNNPKKNNPKKPVTDLDSMSEDIISAMKSITENAPAPKQRPIQPKPAPKPVQPVQQPVQPPVQPPVQQPIQPPVQNVGAMGSGTVSVTFRSGISRMVVLSLLCSVFWLIGAALPLIMFSAAAQHKVTINDGEYGFTTGGFRTKTLELKPGKYKLTVVRKNRFRNFEMEVLNKGKVTFGANSLEAMSDGVRLIPIS